MMQMLPHSHRKLIEIENPDRDQEFLNLRLKLHICVEFTNALAETKEGATCDDVMGLLSLLMELQRDLNRMNVSCD